MKGQRLAIVLIVGVVVVSTGAGVLLYTGGSDLGPDTQSNGTNSTGDDVAVLNQSADGKVYLDVASDPQRDRADLGHALDGLYDEKSINVSNIDFAESQREASTIAIATDGRSNATYIADWVEKHLDHPRTNADSASSNDSGAASPQAQCGVEPTYYQIDFVAGEPIEELQGPEGTYTPDELIRFAHSNSEKNDIRRSSNGEFTTNESLRNAVDSKSIRVEDGTAKVSFSISEDSAPVKLTLASYTKPQRIWTRATESEQEFVDSDTRTFKPGGSYTLSVDLPDSKVVPCETDTAPDQSNPSIETDTSDSPRTPQTSTPSGTPETATADTTTSETTSPETTEAAPGTSTSGTTTSDTTPETTSETTSPETSEDAPGTPTSGTTTSETTNPGTTDAPSATTTTTPPTETPAADLGVTKTVNDANATVGENVTFTIEVTNNGPGAASNISVDEMLGSDLAYQSGEVSQGVYDPVTGVYSVGTLANGETATLEITTTIESTDNTTNAVKVMSDQPDPNPPNNNDSANPTPSVADLSLAKNVNESAPNIGENVKYTLTLSNDGPNSTPNVSVADTLPEGLTFVSASATQGSYDNGTGLWTVNSLNDSSEATLAIVATVESSDNVTNVAEVNSSDTYDPDSTPNNDDPDEDDRGSTTIDGQSSDLSVTKTVNDSNVTIGDSVMFSVEVTNNGPDAATNVSVNEMLGDGYSLQSASTTQGSYDKTTNVYDVGTLENGEKATLTLTATIESPTDTTNAVEVTSETPDPNGPNNNDSVDPTPSVADLALDKSVNESTPNVGDNVEYTLTLSNDGPNATSNVTVVDALPDGLSFVSSTAGQGSYDNATGLWTVGELAGGVETTLSVVATVESTDDVTNIAEVNSSNTFDPNSTPNNNASDEDDQDSSTVNGQSANLAVSKTTNATDATVGDNVIFTVTVTNNGPDTATNVSATESLGSGFAFQSASTTQGSYDANTSVYTVGTLDSNETATLTLIARINSTDNTTNAVEVTGDQPDPVKPNNNDSVNPTPAVADLSLTKNVNESAPNVGDTVEYTLTLTNDGPNATAGVTVADALPDDVSYENVSATQGSYDAGANLWTVDSLADDGEATLSIVATVESTEDITNVAEVNSSDTYDPDSTPNNDNPDEDDRGSTTINGQSADLAVSKTVDDTNVTVGDTVEFTVKVTNNGPDTATNVAVDEILGTGLALQSTSVSKGSYDNETNTYTVGTLASDETATLTLTATIESADDTANAVEVTSDTPDPNDPNNNDSVDPTPSVADLALTKSVNDSAPNVGETIEYTVTLTNNGPNATSGVAVVDELPDGLVEVNATASQGSYDAASGLWTVGTLGDGDQSTLTVTATVQSTADVTNVAEVNSSNTFDPNSTPNNGESGENDQGNATVNGQSADLAVTKSVDDGEATVGDNVTFTVDVTNTGPDTASNVVVDEALPAGLIFQNASATQGAYDESSDTYTVGDLEDGETATLTLMASVDSADESTLENVATATSDTFDPDDSNNEDSATPSPQVADLSLTKTVNDSTPPANSNVEYTLTLTNDGPNTATGVEVTDTLPDGLSLVSAEPSTGSHDSGVWSVDKLASGEETTLTLTATVENQGDVTNTVEVTASDQFDPDSTPGNDVPDEDDQASTTVSGQAADLAVTKSVDDGGATVGDDVTFTVDVTNNGPNTATNVVVDETLPNGLTFVSASPSQGSYDESASTYNVGDLASGETATLELTATIEDTTNLENIATATSDTPDPDDSDNEGSATPSPQVADLSLDKSVNESAPPTGGGVEFTLTVTNNGPNATSNVAVEDTLPDGLSFVEASGQGSYSADTGVWDVGDLAANEEATLTMIATVESSGEVTNIAEVTASDAFDPNSAPDNGEPGENDQDSVTLQPTVPQCSIQLDSVTAPDSVSQGDSATIEAGVTNNGLKDGCGATATLNATGESTRAVDIAFLIDTSGSTQPYISQIASELSGFTDDLEAQGIDARFAVISYGGNGYVRLDQSYTASASQTRATLNSLNSQGGVERNYGAIQAALNDLNPRSEANTFLIDVTDEDSDTPGDSGVPPSDPSQSQVANQIDSAGASFIAVSPTQDEIKNPERAGYNPDQDIKVLSEQVQDGFWINLFTPQSGDGDALNNFVGEFSDIVIDRVNEGISRDQSVTLDGGESGTLSFTVDTSSFQAGTDLEYTVTVGGETRTGTITVTGSGSSSVSVAASAASTDETLLSPITKNSETMSETTAPSETTESSSENASSTTQTPTTDSGSETTTNDTETVTDEPTETKTATDDTTTETPATAETEPTTETTQTPTEASTETTETAPTEENMTAKASPSTMNETTTSATNATDEATENTTTERPTETAETAATMVNTTTATPTTEPQAATNKAAETSTEAENTTAPRR